ncbi:MAG TPA: alpha/beta hydrolase [Rhizomicrobium sp.]|nr:alpha/beta hydrolase [Rhizomicrobium sp.]
MTTPVRKTLPLPEGEVSCLVWDGSGPFLHFAHATGFNAQTYRGLLTPLADRFRIAAADQRGHGFSTLPTGPGLARNWTVYRDDLIRILDRLGMGPAILSGHSMGGTVSLMAAAAEPERVRGLVLVEPVMIPAVAGLLQVFARLRGSNPGPNLADRAEQRRDTFASFDAALTAYTGRGAFKSWQSGTLADYLHGGLIEDPETHAVKLACRPSWEAETFRTTPYGMARLVRRVKCPVTVLYGTIASTCRDSEAEVFRRAGARVVRVDGASHFLPMEHPDLVREEIAKMAAGV